MRVYIDNREQKRITPATTYYQKYNPVVMEMPVGDYAFRDNGINVIFEYKTIEDYLNSISDKRVFNQALKQSQVYDYHFVIIVGSTDDEKKAKKKKGYHSKNYISKDQLFGSYASLVEFTSILRVDTENQAFMLMEKFALKCTRDKPLIHRFPKNYGCPAYRVLVNNVAGIGDVTALNICKELGLWSVFDVFNLNMDLLVKVKGIGRKKAENILVQLIKDFS